MDQRNLNSSKKILLMGAKGSGKTSMRSIIFADNSARDCWKLPATKSVERHSVSLLRGWRVELWDCEGEIEVLGQVKISELLKDVTAVVYVFDLTSDSWGSKDMSDFEALVRLMRDEPSNSDVSLFVLLHKADQAGPLTGSIKERETEIRRRALPTLAHCYVTSIWDESIYRAWSGVMGALLPITNHLQAELSRLVEKLRADEAIIYEQATLLAVAHVAKRHHGDSHRYEKISNMMKRLWSSTKKLNAVPTSIRIRLREGRRIFIEQLNTRAILVLVTGSGATEEVEGEVQNSLQAFQTVLSAVVEGRPEVDPHMM